jgi:hypothetical protein
VLSIELDGVCSAVVESNMELPFASKLEGTAVDAAEDVLIKCVSELKLVSDVRMPTEVLIEETVEKMATGAVLEVIIVSLGGIDAVILDEVLDSSTVEEINGAVDDTKENVSIDESVDNTVEDMLFEDEIFEAIELSVESTGVVDDIVSDKDKV